MLTISWKSQLASKWNTLKQSYMGMLCKQKHCGELYSCWLGLHIPLISKQQSLVLTLMSLYHLSSFSFFIWFYLSEESIFLSLFVLQIKAKSMFCDIKSPQKPSQQMSQDENLSCKSWTKSFLRTSLRAQIISDRVGFPSDFHSLNAEWICSLTFEGCCSIHMSIFESCTPKYRMKNFQSRPRFSTK